MNIYDKSYISKKAAESGFNRDTYEKVLRLVDVLDFINQDDFLNKRLALKGGTAINLLEFDLPRLSVDIDLDYTVNNDANQMKKDREDISDKIFNFMEKQGYSKKKDNRTSFILDSFYFSYVNTSGNKDNIKFDINYVMRAHIYEVEKKTIITDILGEKNDVNALNSIEIYGSKINALNNRAAVRDLYDVWKMIKSNMMNNKAEQIKKVVIFYHILTADEVSGKFDLSMVKKLSQNDVLRELVPVLKKGEVFILKEVMGLIQDFVSSLMNMSDSERRFIKNFVSGDYNPELLFDDLEILNRIRNHPMAIWKAGKLKEV